MECHGRIRGLGKLRPAALMMEKDSDEDRAPSRGTTVSSSTSRPAGPSEGSILRHLNWKISAGMSAELVVDMVAPNSAAMVKARLRRERVLTAADLANLDKGDLRELGLSMVERSKILSWAKRAFRSSAVTPSCSVEVLNRTSGMDTSKETLSEGDSDKVLSPPVLNSPLEPQMLRLTSDQGDYLSCLNMPDTLLNDADDQSQHLDNVEAKADFWCRLVTESGPRSSLHSDIEHVDKLLRSGGEVCLDDLRENVLEKLFDLSPQRLKEVYESIDRDFDGRILKEELLEGLHRCGLHDLDEAVEKVLSVVSRDSRSMRLDEFESVLTRLKLAQLLSASRYLHQSVAEQLIIMDYNSYKVEERKMSLQDFFFAHRRPEFPMRWVHLRQLDLIMLLAITVKYQLHPLSVEDVIDQAPTKIDRYGGHYFVSIEHLEVISAINGLEPVKVRGRHVTLFCAGPPHVDTVITVSQAERSFQQDWPGQVLPGKIGSMEDTWISRLQKRLQAVRSRVRERQADFLMYEILDLCTDDIRLVTRVYTKRLNWLEETLQQSKINSEQGKFDWYNEVGVIHLQLAVVSRRLRGLQRILRRLADDPDIAQVLSGYLQDVADHINEAYEDAGHLGDKCLTLSSAYEHAQDRAQENIRWQNTQASNLKDERMNKMLFILTIFTTVFTPLTFIAGIYGMNFQNRNGLPTIPELLQPHGYYMFLTFTMVYLVVGCVAGVWLWRRVNRGIVKDKQSGKCVVKSSRVYGTDYERLP